ncbi:MAG: hypothetical protein AAGK78_07860, partial [Planctomycetota bacterium]
LIVRNGYIEPADMQAVLQTPQDLWRAADTAPTAWGIGGGLDTNVLLASQTKIDLGVLSADQPPRVNVQGDTGDSAISVTPAGVYTALGEKAVVATGFLGGKSLDLGDFKLDVAANGFDFGSFTAVALDDMPLAESERVLLTYVGRAQNLGMGWNDERTTVGTAWGEGPAQIEQMPMTVTLDGGAGMRAFLLTETGQRRGDPIALDGGSFEWTPEQKTIYVELVRE